MKFQSFQFTLFHANCMHNFCNLHFQCNVSHVHTWLVQTAGTYIGPYDEGCE